MAKVGASEKQGNFGQQVAVTSNSASDENPILPAYSISLEGVFIPAQNALLSYEPMLTAWEDALNKYTDDFDAFLKALQEAKEALEKSPGLNFLNIEFEKLFDIPIDPGRESLVQIVQQNSAGRVDSLAKDLFLDSDLSINKVESESTNLVYVTQRNNNTTTTMTVNPNPGPQTPPVTPDIVLNAQNTNGFNSEVYFINIVVTIINTGNIFAWFFNIMDWNYIKIAIKET